MKTKKEHNYRKKINEMIAEGKILEGVSMADIYVFHDDFCGVFYKKMCDCNPEIQVKKRKRK